MSLYSYFEQKMNRPDFGLLVLRVVFGVLITLFGVGKLLEGGPMFEQIGGAMAMFGVTWQPKLWGLLCALTETFGGVFIVFGIFMRPAALLLVFNMIVACAVVPKYYGAPDFSSAAAFSEWLGKIDPPYIFCAAFICLLFTGPGKYAIHKSGGGRSGAKAAKE
ncbi:MAG TPA: DoxX family protein [Opitutales bacterium]|jgi:putative oxidoreductase|nr:DoxX family protein [Opitutales bacterium]